jgi:hypothetical protein
MTRRDSITAAICICLHIIVLLLAWRASELTPRIIEVEVVEGCRS